MALVRDVAAAWMLLDRADGADIAAVKARVERGHFAALVDLG